MPKLRTQKQTQLIDMHRAILIYARLRSLVAREALTWFKRHRYAKQPVPRVDKPLADAILRLLDVGKVVEKLLDTPISTHRARRKRG